MLALLISLFFIISASEAAISDLKLENSSVEFVAKGKPAFITIKGMGSGVIGRIENKDNNLSGTFSFDLSSLSTGIELRDEHMLKTYLEIEKYPKASLKLTEAKANSSGDEFEFKGELNIHGQTRLISGVATLSQEQLTAGFKIKLSDFAINIPSFQGITVAEEIEVSIKSQILEVK